MSSTSIMLVCAAGMSTSMLVTNMEKAADQRGIEADIFAVSADEVESKLKETHVDVLLLGPQIRYLKTKIEKEAEQYDITVDVINMQDYGLMNGENVLDSALALITKSS